MNRFLLKSEEDLLRFIDEEIYCYKSKNKKDTFFKYEQLPKEYPCIVSIYTIDYDCHCDHYFSYTYPDDFTSEYFDLEYGVE